ncbi:hypothetical protein AB0J35_36440 [Nonomuraea angiospora]|uniref:hypothetical protein n=1 Tax=Nonomuraea angiospora TaxID=46172 RepID=UPI0034324A74
MGAPCYLLVPPTAVPAFLGPEARALAARTADPETGPESRPAAATVARAPPQDRLAALVAKHAGEGA